MTESKIKKKNVEDMVGLTSIGYYVDIQAESRTRLFLSRITLCLAGVSG